MEKLEYLKATTNPLKRSLEGTVTRPRGQYKALCKEAMQNLIQPLGKWKITGHI